MIIEPTQWRPTRAGGSLLTHDARPDLDAVDRDEAADVLVLIGNRATQRLGDRHLRRSRLWALGGRVRALAGGQHDHQQHDCWQRSWRRCG